MSCPISRPASGAPATAQRRESPRNSAHAPQPSRLSLMNKLLPTTVVGSYPQPDWLIDRATLSKSVPRVRQRDIWRIPEPLLEQAQDDATILAIRDMERAGIDIITDGEARRESYFNRFATALDGVDIEKPGTAIARTGAKIPVPRVAGPIKRRHAVEVR